VQMQCSTEETSCFIPISFLTASLTRWSISTYHFFHCVYSLPLRTTFTVDEILSKACLRMPTEWIIINTGKVTSMPSINLHFLHCSLTVYFFNIHNISERGLCCKT
jgi:hypothetical protein